MNISLTPKLEGFVKAKVKTGDYNNASEVIREALRVLQEREADRKVQIGAFGEGRCCRAGNDGRNTIIREIEIAAFHNIRGEHPER